MRSKEKDYVAAYWQKWRAANMPTKPRRCAGCGVEFFPRGPQKRCDPCRALICAHCGKSFVPKNSTLNHKFCGVDCASAIRRGGNEPPHLAKNRGKKPRTYHLRHRDKHGCAADREWRKLVFARDNFTCQGCGVRGGTLQAHHVKPYKAHPELRHDLSNGQTLCLECHKKTDTYGWANYWRTQIAARRLAQEVLPFREIPRTDNITKPEHEFQFA